MDFNFTTETIIPDNTGMITIGGTQGVELPAGTQLQRPSSPAAGTLRFTTANNTLEYWNGSTWYSLVAIGTDVTSFSAGTTGLTPSTATTGAVTLAGTLNIANGGTGLTSTPANGQLLIGNASGYTLSTLTGGTGITVTNAAGSITLSLTASAYVSSFSGGSTGLTPSTATTGAVTLAGTLNVANGGTGLTTTPTNGQIDIGNGSGFTRATLTAGTAVSVTNGSGSITIANTGVTSNVAGTGISVSSATGAVTISNTGVTSIAGTANQVTASASTGAVTLSLPSAVTITTLNATNLNASGLTTNGSLYVGASGAITSTAAMTNGQLLVGSTGSNPVLATLTAGTGVSVTNGAGSISIANTGVVSVATSGAGIATTAATGAITLSNPNDAVSTVTASGTNQATAVALSLGYNNVTSVAAGTGVICPSNPTPGAKITIDNSGANTLTVYPAVGATVDTGAANASFSIPANTNSPVTLVATSSTSWDTIDPTILAGTGISVTGGIGSVTISTSGIVSSSQGTTSEILVNGVTTAQTGTTTISIAPNVILPGNLAETVPNGTTAQRPTVGGTATDAMWRFNTTEEIFEGYASIAAGPSYTGTYTSFSDSIAWARSDIYRKRRWYVDDFMFGNASNVTGSLGIGDLNWAMTTTATTTTNSFITGVADHPGIISLGPAGTAAQYVSLTMTSATGIGQILPSQLAYFSFLLRIPNVVNGTTGTNVGFGQPTNVNGLGTDSIFFTFVGSYTNIEFFTKKGNTLSAQVTGPALASNTWYFCEAWRDINNNWWCSINGTIYGYVAAASAPTAAFQAGVNIQTISGTATTTQIDYFSMMTVEMGNRYP